jgi:hypothetical protein
MRPVSALLVRKRQSRTHGVLAVVPVEEVMEDVMRAMALEAVLEECGGVLLLMPTWQCAAHWVELRLVGMSISVAHDVSPLHRQQETTHTDQSAPAH